MKLGIGMLKSVSKTAWKAAKKTAKTLDSLLGGSSEDAPRVTDLKKQLVDYYRQLGEAEYALLENGQNDEQLASKIEEINRDISQLKSELEMLHRQDVPGQPPPSLSDLKKKRTDDSEIQQQILRLYKENIRLGIFANESDRLIIEKLVRDLAENDVEIRRLAVIELGKIQNPLTIPVLMKALCYNHVPLQIEVINSLISLEAQQSYSALVEFVTHKNEKLRREAIRGLYKIGGTKSVPYLLEALNDRSADIRRSAVLYLGWLRAGAVSQDIIQKLKDEKAAVRKAAAISLANLETDAAALPLIRALKDDHREVREAILQTLSSMVGIDLPYRDFENKKERYKEVEDLKKWWLKVNIGSSGKDMISDKMGDLSKDDVSSEVRKISHESLKKEIDEIETLKKNREQVFKKVALEVASKLDEIDKESEAAILGMDEKDADMDEVDVSKGEEIVSPVQAADLDNLTKKELLALCKAHGLEYNTSATKPELIDLLIQSGQFWGDIDETESAFVGVEVSDETDENHEIETNQSQKEEPQTVGTQDELEPETPEEDNSFNDVDPMEMLGIGQMDEDHETVETPDESEPESEESDAEMFDEIDPLGMLGADFTPSESNKSGLEKLTKAELQELCQKHNIEFITSMKKQELIELLVESGNYDDN